MRRLERLFEWLYERYGMGGLVPFIALLAFVSISLTVVLNTATEIRDAHGSLHEFVRFGLVAEGAALLGGLIGIAINWRSIGLALAWSRRQRTPELAVEVWREGMLAPRRIIGWSLGAIMVLEVVPLALGTAHFGLPAYTLVLEIVQVGLTSAAAAVFILLGIELALVPAMRDAAGWLTPGLEPDVPARSLWARILIPVPGAILFTASFVGAFTNSTASPIGRLETALALGAGMVVIAMALFVVATRSTLAPIDALMAATRRVRDGDLEEPVPILSGDELGALARSFNQMLDGLREREVLRADLRDSRARIAATADAERRRLERDLHDGAQQHLVLLGLKLAMIERLIASDPAAAESSARELRGDLAHALDELRDLARGIYPAILENEGLEGALREAAARTAIPTKVDCDGTTRYSPAVEAAVYFCCLEALQNAAKHAGAGSTATVSLSERDSTLLFAVADDGVGFDTTLPGASSGIQNMHDRIGALGGRVEISSAAGAGTRIEAAIPLEKRRASGDAVPLPAVPAATS